MDASSSEATTTVEQLEQDYDCVALLIWKDFIRRHLPGSSCKFVYELEALSEVFR